MAIETMRGTSMTDQTKAVAALAEAMEPLYTDPVLVYTIQGHARRALQAIQANPDILREYGIGRLPTRSDLESLEWTTIYGDSDEIYHHVDSGAIDEMIRVGVAVDDPDPQPPELPSVEAELKMRDEEIERAAIRRDEAYDQYQRLQGTWIDLVVRRTQIAAARPGGRSDR